MLLTPVSISYLPQFILVTAIAVYLLRLWGREFNHPPHLIFMAMFYVFAAVFILQLFFESSLPPSGRLLVVYLENTVVALMLNTLLRFAYSFPDESPARKREARLVNAASLLYLIYEAGFAIYRFWTLMVGESVEYRPSQADFVLVAGFLWVLAVFLRQSGIFSLGSAFWQEQSSTPQRRGARAALALALVCLLPVGIALANAAFSYRNISGTLYQLVMSLGIGGTALALPLIYMNVFPVTTSFSLKVTGISLVFAFSILGMTSWILAPALSESYKSSAPSHRSFRFFPVSDGAYQVSEVPFYYEEKKQNRLSLFDVKSENTSVEVEFPFTFYGKPQDKLYVVDNGAIGFASPLALSDLQYNYGFVSGIAPLYVDLEPGQPSGGVFAYRANDHLTITWEDVPARYQPDERFNFQLTLYTNGEFEINYGKMPAALDYSVNNRPEYTAWFSGILCGDWQVCNQPAGIKMALCVRWPKELITGGFVIDYYLQYRRYMHDVLLPLAWSILAVSLLLLFGLPYLLRRMVGRPLQNLLDGMYELSYGKILVRIPVEQNDEIGMLTRAFNKLAATLDERASKQSPDVSDAGSPCNELTPRQLELLHLLVDGLTYKQMGIQLNISERAVKYNMAQIFTLLQIENRQQAIAYARKMLPPR